MAVRCAGHSYQVYIKSGILDQLGAVMRDSLTAARALVITDRQVDALYGERCRQSLTDRGWTVQTAVIRPGESSKSLPTAARLYEAALDSGLDRFSPVVALGGGVVGDLAGFVAATYLRGVPLISVPTTLLAQVDSSVGGKVAVNHPRGKNLIGTFYQPHLVATDPEVLVTLSDRQRRAGLSEIIKCALIGDRHFFQWLEVHLDRILQFDLEAVTRAVAFSVRFKGQVVEQDERESSYRRILNFGHTLGHALEASTGYRYYLHGEAVLIGSVAAVELSRRLGLIDHNTARKVIKLISRVGLCPPPPGLTGSQVWDRLKYDKKRCQDQPVFVLLPAIGSAVINTAADQELVKGLIREYLEGKGPFEGKPGKAR
ncbi:MAG TPA: 3-dehydroquinate synthase [Firmicutes bacterium]|nr:3-dehydroquinate synthase [Bacillota bacterium]